MNSPEQLTLFIVGIILVLIGVGLTIYGSVQRQNFAGDNASTPDTLKAIADLFDALGRFIGPSRASRAGVFCIIIGLLLIFVPFFVPQLRGAA